MLISCRVPHVLQRKSTLSMQQTDMDAGYEDADLDAPGRFDSMGMTGEDAGEATCFAGIYHLAPSRRNWVPMCLNSEHLVAAFIAAVFQLDRTVGMAHILMSAHWSGKMRGG